MNERRSSINMVVVGCVYFALFGFSVWIHFENPILRFPRPDSQFWINLVIDLLIGVGAAIPIIALTGVAVHYLRSFQELTREFHRILGPLTHGEIFFLSIFSALGEEFFFRGFVQGTVGFVLASLIFGLLHSGPSRKYLPWTFFATAVGFLLGWLYEWRSDLLVPVATHFTVNFVNLTLLRKWEDRENVAEPEKASGGIEEKEDSNEG